MCDPATIMLVSTAISGAMGLKSMAEQKSAASQASSNAKATLLNSEEAQNKANAATPNVAALAAGNKGGGGISSTMLTGPTGVDPNSLALGKNTLLGA